MTWPTSTTITCTARPSEREASLEPVVVDTAAWIALLNLRDFLHATAQYVWDVLVEEGTLLVTSEFVLLEVADALSQPNVRRGTTGFIDNLRLTDSLTIVPLDSSLVEKGWALYRSRPDKAWGLTDCTSFLVMEQAGIRDAFTSDHHFTQAGFRKLL